MRADYFEHQHDPEGYNHPDRHERRGPHELKQQFERHYHSSHPRDREDKFYEDSSYEIDAGNRRAENYRQRDDAMERRYYQNIRGDRHTLDDIRQGYGYPSFSNRDEYYDRGSDMQRERYAQQQQGYGSGRLSGGFNVHEGQHQSNHGNSAFGYGREGHHYTPQHNREDNDRDREDHAQRNYRERYGANSDRGGYSNRDPNY
ncbi:hypothetical protein ACXYMU_10335 [Pontibacter sp. CAU 1760]